MLPANWNKSPQGAYFQICVYSPGARLRVCGEEVSQVPVFCFKIAPIGGQMHTMSQGCRGYPGPRRAASLGQPHIESESVVVATRRNQTSRQGTLMRALHLPAAQKRNCPDSCRRCAKLQTSQGPILSDLCDRPILVLSDVGIWTCKYGAGLMCLILGRGLHKMAAEPPHLSGDNGVHPTHSRTFSSRPGAIFSLPGWS